MSVVISVLHTGSRFLAVTFDCEDIFHTHNKLEQVIDDIGGRKTYTPLRHPKDVWESWCKRGRSGEQNMFIDSFHTLAELHKIQPLDIVAVDKKEDPRITDWTPIAHNPISVECPDIDLSSVMKIPFIGDNYAD